MVPEAHKRLMQKAAALLARRAHSRGELRVKLTKADETGPVESVLDRLEQLNLLNDADYAYNSASLWIKRDGWGPAKVRYRLRQRKIAETIAEAAIDRVLAETGEAGALESYLDRRCRVHPLPENRKGIQKLVGALARRGFPLDVIWSVLHQRIPGSAWNDFDTGD
jgi:regulatory protein